MTELSAFADATRPARPGEEILLGFTVALRAAGVAVTHDRAQAYLEAVALAGIANARAAYYAGRATLCGSPADLERYDQVYEAYFDPRAGLPRRRQAPPGVPTASTSILPESEAGGAGEADDEEIVRARASAAEVLRQRDIATLTANEKARLAEMFATLSVRPPLRRSGRLRPWHRGSLDASRTLRASLRRMGEPARLEFRRRALRARPVVLLVDVSGSMSSYADALLRLAHRLGTSGGPVETFALGTRLTRLTRALAARDAERALIAAGETVPDWSGGTRLGETLQAFVDRWGRRGLARGAVVVVFSDGWERGDASLLAEQMARLHRIAHSVVWVNPHRGKANYEPVQLGIRAVLPHVDAFVAGHSLAAFAELLDVISRA
ncbi:vWA domain-containing protein [Cryptosporangium phraense]|uniref:VWA domain-containing protein n=1 Tax=Cryptosporangium phraense TaxID=2593070 RepID=A0A545ART1_9ACTN|nr:VWA domain-containing protein [Cryptosporangium phraense]TQS43961.1 VWA domain-containing protein [Cryptosporangium phraense]